MFYDLFFGIGVVCSCLFVGHVCIKGVTLYNDVTKTIPRLKAMLKSETDTCYRIQDSNEHLRSANANLKALLEDRVQSLLGLQAAVRTHLAVLEEQHIAEGPSTKMLKLLVASESGERLFLQDESKS